MQYMCMCVFVFYGNFIEFNIKIEQVGIERRSNYIT